MEISDAITVLKNGHVTGNVLPSEVNEQILANMMVGRNVLFDTKNRPSRWETDFRGEKTQGFG